MSRPFDAGAGLRTETLSSTEELERLEWEWWKLWADAPNASVFQSPAWLIPWWRHFGGEGLRTLAFRHDGRLVGVAPLFLHTRPDDGVRQLTLVGNGISDQLDVLMRPSSEAGVLDALVGSLSAADDWDFCDLRDLPPGSVLRRAARCLALVEEPDEPCPVLRLSGSPERLEGIVPPALLRKLRYARRRAEREGEVSVVSAATEDVEREIDVLFRLHAARWSERGQEGVVSAARVEAFHREVAPLLARAGMLRLYTLRLDGRAAAALYGFHAHRRTSYYLGGFDPALKILSPGSLVLLHAVEAAVREGALEFDFLRGRERYKYDWGAEDRTHFRLRGYR
ncbi:MAG TPA: GNAT family N-acetyltransferase [Longimicrobiaceae bacterium]|nr:GNAT family N-acetyltransferase [Longimicrobiaceae bacterium]